MITESTDEEPPEEPQGKKKMETSSKQTEKMLQFQYREETGDAEIAIVENGNPGHMAKSTQETRQNYEKRGRR